ncbi:MAG: hypothetical protein RLZZ165_789 [Bacteroidota bacterium]|jgi:hypothetical protein
MLTEIPASKWRELILFAHSFSLESPWEWVDDTQVFGVIDPATGEKVYCSVTGRSSDFKALCMYPGKTGWRSYLQLGDTIGVDLHVSEIMYGIHCLLITFLPPTKAEPDDHHLIRHAGISSIKGWPWVPSFRSNLPSYFPKSPNLREVDMMCAVVPQALALLADLQGSAEFLPAEGLDDQGRLLFSVPAADGSGWKRAWLAPDNAIDFSPPTVQLSQKEIDQCRRLPLEEAMWLMEVFHIPAATINDEEEVPFFPRVVVLFDIEVQEFRGVKLLSPSGFPGLVGESLVDMMVQQGLLPNNLIVSNRNNLILLRGFCKELGIEIHLEDSLNLIPELRKEVTKMTEPRPV